MTMTTKDGSRHRRQVFFRPWPIVLGLLLLVALAPGSGTSQSTDGPEYTGSGELVQPADYREWPFVGSGLGLTYEEGDDGGGNVFTNVFVNPSGFRGFMETGVWPDRTVFVLEFREAQSDSPPNTGGRYQGSLLGLEAEVKHGRFPDGWAYFDFGRGGAASEAPPLTAEQAESCVECHTEETAVERTFVQFYPTLLDVAREKGTLKSGF